MRQLHDDLDRRLRGWLLRHPFEVALATAFGLGLYGVLFLSH